jgi:hypothetical protein
VSTLPAPVVGSVLTVAVEAKHLHWFDPQTKQRVG